MSDEEGFLTRWTRRKQEAKDTDAAPPSPAPTHAADPAREPDAATRMPGAVETARSALPVREFDVASLPPIDTITAVSDIRAFLAPGVPVELTRAALRRAWSTDPAIRDFVGIAENQWDFTVPNEILGFGPLESGEEVRRLVAQVFGDAPPEREIETVDQSNPSDQSVSAASDTRNLPAAPAADAPPPQAADGDPSPSSIVQCSENISAVQYSEQPGEDLDLAQRRGHGRALPQ